MLAMTETAPGIVPNIGEFEKRWHLLHSCGIDKAMLECLKRSGYEYYYPQLRVMRPIPKKMLSLKQRKHAGIFMRPQERPLFPSYLFVRLEIGDGHWHEIFNVLGLRGVSLKEDGSPVVMPSDFIDGLRDREINGAIPGEIPARTLPFKVGDEVRVLDGCFQGLKGTLENIDEHGAIGLLVDMLGRKVRVNDLTAADVEKA